MQSFPHALAAHPHFGPPHLVHRLVGILDHVELVEDHRRIPAMLGHAALAGRAHVHAGLGDGVPVSIVFLQGLHEFRPSLLVLALDGKHQAMNAIRAAIRSGKVEVIDADLSGYFDRIPHRELLRLVARRVSDGRILALIKA